MTKHERPERAVATRGDCLFQHRNLFMKAEFICIEGTLNFTDSGQHKSEIAADTLGIYGELFC
jgi:hypothetical protein